MSLANPNALLWALLAVPIVIFYILKIRLRRVPVSTVIFWRQIFEEKKPRSIWQKLRHLVSLLIQLVLLFLLVGALVEPFFSWEANEARRVVLVIDNSASMNATDDAPTRLAKAKEAGQKIIAGLRFRDEMAIVVAGTQPRVACGLTGHQRTLREALEAVPPTDGPTRLKEAVELARRLVAEQKAEQRNTRVIVLSDGCADGAEQLAADDVQLIAVGKRTGNLGITRFQVRRSILDPVGYEILIEVVNQSDDPAECRLQLFLGDEPVDVFHLKFPRELTKDEEKLDDAEKKKRANEWSKVIEKVSTEGGRLTARLMHPTETKQPYQDALAADNEAVALMPKREEQPVLLVTAEPNLFLEKVLQANPLVRLTTAKEPPATPPAGTVVIYHKVVPDPLPAGPAFVIDPAKNSDLWQVGDNVPTPLVTKQDKDSPLMAHVRLDNVLLPDSKKLTFTEKAGKPIVLAESVTGEPLFAALDRPDGKVLVLPSNLDKGDLPFRTAFPILMTNALNWFGGNRGELREALATGAVTDVKLPSSGQGEFVLRSPDGSTRKLPTGVLTATVGPLDRCGVWAVVPAGGGEPVQEIACNLANRAESDIRPPEDLPQSAPESSVVTGLLGRPVWFYLIGLAWVLAAAEWYLYQRRWIS
jgi:hypothetical protein